MFHPYLKSKAGALFAQAEVEHCELAERRLDLDNRGETSSARRLWVDSHQSMYLVKRAVGRMSSNSVILGITTELGLSKSCQCDRGRRA